MSEGNIDLKALDRWSCTGHPLDLVIGWKEHKRHLGVFQLILHHLDRSTTVSIISYDLLVGVINLGKSQSSDLFGDPGK
jgi:hypothetical protein